MKINACLFDLDGTLLNTLTTIAYYGNISLKKFGLAAIADDEYRYLVGDGAKLLVERMLRYDNAYTSEMYGKVYKYYNEQYNADVKRYTAPYDGIAEMLTELKKRGIKRGVISNKPDFAARGAVSEFLGHELIDVCHGQIEGIKIKPDPSGALAVLSEMGVQPSECMYIGDTGVDMQTGKNLGAYTVGVLWGFRDLNELKENGADTIVSAPHEILNLL